MADLLTKQNVLQRSIERSIENFKKVGKANLTPAKIRTKIASFKANWIQFQDGHVSLLRAVAETSRASMDYFTENRFEVVEEIYQTTWEHMAECLEELEPIVSPNQSLNNSHAASDSSNLALTHMPPIRLPPFDGDYSQWESFRDRFTALVIDNNALSQFARMHYLASSLKGRALDCLGGIAITADNFPVAWGALKSRFENKRRLLSSHFSSLFGLSALTKESALELQALCDKINIAVASLTNLARSPSDLWNDFLVHLLTQKLDPASRKAWNLKFGDTDTPPTFEELNRFLSN
ncbi:PREDICTED: uncharacterized protein LOC105561844, partial [Vollenhovia emeryi]|uniref:uncharacterized protein LOC105561844 n=1 Tax=Vollenhovia emeryi TaxID=411798 RepID=UPI0005F3DA37